MISYSANDKSINLRLPYAVARGEDPICIYLDSLNRCANKRREAYKANGEKPEWCSGCQLRILEDLMQETRNLFDGMKAVLFEEKRDGLHRATETGVPGSQNPSDSVQGS